jgi:hypothetical protein
MLDTDADDVGIPASSLIDREFGSRQDAFRRRVRDSGLLRQSFASPAEGVDRAEQEVDPDRRDRRRVHRQGLHHLPRGFVQQLVGLPD